MCLQVLPEVMSEEHFLFVRQSHTDCSQCVGLQTPLIFMHDNSWHKDLMLFEQWNERPAAQTGEADAVGVVGELDIGEGTGVTVGCGEGAREHTCSELR